MKPILSQLLLCLGFVSVLHAQSITPPAGPIATSMKTFQQVQPRTPLVTGQPGVALNQAGTITISQPGSYYLMGNVSVSALGASGVVIASDNVTLDLNGFTISKTASTGGAGVFFGTSRNIHIHDGNITSTTTYTNGSFSTGGFALGIAGDGADTIVTDCFVEGIATTGIQIASGVVERCLVNSCAGTGIQALTVLDCLATTTGGSGIRVPPSANSAVIQQSAGVCAGTAGSGIEARAGVVRDCRGGNRGTTVAVDESAGIFAKSATNCIGSSVSGCGMYADVGSNLRGTSVSGPGLYVYVVADSRGSSSDGRGIWANQIDGCMGTSSTAIGLWAVKTISFSQGVRTGGVAIECPVATACSVPSGSTTVNQKFFGTP